MYTTFFGGLLRISDVHHFVLVDIRDFSCTPYFLADRRDFSCPELVQHIFVDDISDFSCAPLFSADIRDCSYAPRLDFSGRQQISFRFLVVRSKFHLATYN